MVGTRFALSPSYGRKHNEGRGPPTMVRDEGWWARALRALSPPYGIYAMTPAARSDLSFAAS
jgi:hypothetical protein